MNLMEQKGTSSSPSLEVWGALGKYQAFIQELNSWKEVAKLDAMESPATFDDMEPIIEEAYRETLAHAAESGPRTEEYFKKRIAVLRFQQLGTNESVPGVPIGEVVESSAGREHLPVREPALVAETGASDPASETAPVATVAAPDRPLSEREKMLYGYSSMHRNAQSKKVVSSSSSAIPTSSSSSRKDEPKGFEVLAGFTPMKKFEEATAQGTPHEHIPTTQEPAPVIEAVIAPKEEKEQESSFSPESVEARVKRSIENGSFDLAFATEAQLFALLHHADVGIVARTQAELATRRASISKDTTPGEPKAMTDADAGSPVVVPQEAPISESAPREKYSHYLSGLIRSGRGSEVPLGVLRSWKDMKEVKSYLETVYPQDLLSGKISWESLTRKDLKYLANHANTEIAQRASQELHRTTVSEDSSRETGIPRVHPSAEDLAASLLREEEEEREKGISHEAPSSFSEVNETVEPRSDGSLVGPDIAPPEVSPISPEKSLPKSWNELSDTERAQLTEESVSRYPVDALYHLRRKDGVIEDWVLLSISDDGRAFLVQPAANNDGLVKYVDLLEFRSLNPLSAKLQPQEFHGGAEVEIERSATDPNTEEMDLEEVVIPNVNEFSSSTKDKEVFAGQCEFLFPKGKKYRVKSEDGTITTLTLLALSPAGAVFVGKDGVGEKQVPLQELFELNIGPKEESHPEEDLVTEDEVYPEIAPLVGEQFRETFGITPESLQSIPEFAALSEGRQLLVHHELNNYAVSRIKSDALLRYRDRYQSLQVPLSELEQKLVSKEGLFGGIARLSVGLAQLRHKETWQRAGMSILKRKVLAEEEKVLAEEFTSGKFDPESYVRELSLAAGEGPEATVSPDGKVRLEFLSPEAIIGLSEEGAASIEAFNQSAEKFATVPHRWNERGATKDEQAKYREAQEEYHARREQMLTLLREKEGNADALLDTNELDRRITFTQFFHTHPEAAEQLASIQDQNVWLAAAKDIARTRGSMMALGGSIRTVAAAIASQALTVGSMFVAAPLAGAATGGYMGHKRAETELAERELLAKAGVKDESKEALNIVDAGERTHEESGKRIAGLSGKLDLLSRALQDASDSALSKDLVAQMERRIAYTEGKLQQGLVNYGSKEVEIKNQYALLRSLAEAKALLVVERENAIPVAADAGARGDQSGRRSGAQRLEDLLRLHEQKISIAQQEYVRKTTKQAAIYGAAFAFGGALVADIIHGTATPGGSTIGRTADTILDVKQEGAPEEDVVAEALPGQIAPIVEGAEAVGRALREGWNGPLVQKALSDPTFNKEYLTGVLTATGRTPEVGLSDVELNALLATEGDPARAAAHEALLLSLRHSSTRLSDEAIAKLMIAHKIPDSLADPYVPGQGGAAPVSPSTQEAVVKEPAPAPASPSAPAGSAPPPVPVPASATEGAEHVSVYAVKEGDNLSALMKANVPALKSLSPQGQENVIQNFLQKATPEELQAIGVTDPNVIVVGQEINLEKLNEVLLSQKVKGESLVAHAQELFGGPSPIQSVVPEVPVVGNPIESESPGTPVEVFPADSLDEETQNTRPSLLSEDAPSAVSVPRPASSEISGEVASIDRPRALALADEYLTKDMMDPRTGKPTALWTEMRRYDAKDVFSLRQQEVTADMWKKVVAVRQYASAQGLDESHRVIPREKESLGDFLRRGHTERVMADGERNLRAPHVAATGAVPLSRPFTPPLEQQTVPRPSTETFEPRRLVRPTADEIPQSMNIPPPPPQGMEVPPGYEYRRIPGQGGFQTPRPPLGSIFAEPPPPPRQGVAPSMESQTGYQYRRLP